jgi:large subunit ribosomal protein L19e
MTLISQRRLAADIMKIGLSRVWIDPEDADRVALAITRNEIRKLIHEGVIRKKPETGISRGRKRTLRFKKTIGRRKGPGTRKGSRVNSRRGWINRIRVIREQLRSLRDRRFITTQTYRRLMLLSKGGTFRSRSHLDEYVQQHKLAKRR